MATDGYLQTKMRDLNDNLVELEGKFQTMLSQYQQCEKRLTENMDKAKAWCDDTNHIVVCMKESEEKVLSLMNKQIKENNEIFIKEGMMVLESTLKKKIGESQINIENKVDRFLVGTEKNFVEGIIDCHERIEELIDTLNKMDVVKEESMHRTGHKGKWVIAKPRISSWIKKNTQEEWDRIESLKNEVDEVSNKGG